MSEDKDTLKGRPAGVREGDIPTGKFNLLPGHWYWLNLNSGKQLHVLIETVEHPCIWARYSPIGKTILITEAAIEYVEPAPSDKEIRQIIESMVKSD